MTSYVNRQGQKILVFADGFKISENKNNIAFDALKRQQTERYNRQAPASLVAELQDAINDKCEADYIAWLQAKVDRYTGS